MLLDAGTRHVDTLRVLYRSDEIPDEVFGFHVQQAAEKLLKGWIALLGEVYPLTHDVEELLNLLAVGTVPWSPSGTWSTTRRTQSSFATWVSPRMQNRLIVKARSRSRKRCWNGSGAG